MKFFHRCLAVVIGFSLPGIALSHYWFQRATVNPVTTTVRGTSTTSAPVLGPASATQFFCRTAAGQHVNGPHTTLALANAACDLPAPQQLDAPQRVVVEVSTRMETVTTTTPIVQTTPRTNVYGGSTLRVSDAHAQIIAALASSGGGAGGGGGGAPSPGAPGECTLWVDGATGSDATSKASNTAMSPWDTIGRAAWGSTDRSSPNTSEAAAAGDVVCIAGGTYTTTVAVNSRSSPVYNPANEGTSTENYLAFVCDGVCILGAENADGPVVGAHERDYVWWYADIANGDWWQITAYAPEDDAAASDEVNTTPDTGPVWGDAIGLIVEGFNIDGGVDAGYGDNYNGIRFENCESCLARNNEVYNFDGTPGVNASAITLYGSPGSIVEHNYLHDSNVGVYLKDTGFTLDPDNQTVRLNRIEAVQQCFRFSFSPEIGGNRIVQNVCSASGEANTWGVFLTGNGTVDDWIVNNTFYNVAACKGDGVVTTGNRFWNNICHTGTYAVYVSWTNGPVDSTIWSHEHNVYYNYSDSIYEDFSTDYTLAQWIAATGNDDAAPDSIESNPLLANIAGDDFRLCTASGVPHASCSGASPAIALGVDILDLDGDSSTSDNIPAGAHVTGSEEIGLQETPTL
jgi:hypothetical protein